MLLPLTLLWPSVFGSADFVPFDLARLPPLAGELTDAELAAVRAQPSNMDASDTTILVLPEIELAKRELAAGRFPAWNPAARFGAPLFGNGLAGMAYPPNWVMLAAGDPRSVLGWLAWLSFAVAGLSTFGLLRELRVGVAPALFAGIAFALSGTMLANAHYYWRMNALAWLPAMLWLVLRTARRPRGLEFAALSVAVAMAWLSGFPPWAAIGSGITILWALGAVAGARGRVLAAIGLGVGVAAVQVAPMLSFYPESNRDLDPPADVIAREAFDPMGLAGYLVPSPFGHPSADAEPAYETSPAAHYLFSRTSWLDGEALFPHNYDFAEYSVYPGTLTLVLALYGMFVAWRRGRTGRMVAVGLVVFVVVATAPAWLAGVYGLPLLRNLQPVRYIGPVSLFVAVLAGIGLDGLVRDRRGKVCAGIALALGAAAVWMYCGYPARQVLLESVAEHYGARLPHLSPDIVDSFLGGSYEAGRERWCRQALAASVAMGLAALWFWLATRLRTHRLRAAWVAVTVLVTFGELAWVARGVVVNVELSPKRRTAVHELLAAERLRLGDRGGFAIVRAASAPKTPIDLPAGTLFGDRIRDLHSFAFVDPWSHRLFARVFGEGQMHHLHWPNAFPDDQRLQHPMLDLMGVELVLGTGRLEHAGAEVATPVPGFHVYRRPRALPRAFVVPSLTVVEDDEGAIERIAGTDFDPRASVVVDAEAAARLGAGPAVDRARREVRFRIDRPSTIELEVDAGPAGYLVLGDSFMSGWRATVDGEPSPIVRGNLFMRVVAIAEGAHTVRFEYRAPGLLAGAVVSLLSLLAVVGFTLSRRRRPAAEADSTSP